MTGSRIITGAVVTHNKVLRSAWKSEGTKLLPTRTTFFLKYGSTLNRNSMMMNETPGNYLLFCFYRQRHNPQVYRYVNTPHRSATKHNFSVSFLYFLQSHSLTLKPLPPFFDFLFNLSLNSQPLRFCYSPLYCTSIRRTVHKTFVSLTELFQLMNTKRPKAVSNNNYHRTSALCSGKSCHTRKISNRHVRLLSACLLLSLCISDVLHRQGKQQ